MISCSGINRLFWNILMPSHIHFNVCHPSDASSQYCQCWGPVDFCDNNKVLQNPAPAPSFIKRHLLSFKVHYCTFLDPFQSTASHMGKSQSFLFIYLRGELNHRTRALFTVISNALVLKRFKDLYSSSRSSSIGCFSILWSFHYYIVWVFS